MIQSINKELTKLLGTGGTYKNGKPVNYGNGYQVGIKKLGEFKTPLEMVNYISNNEITDFGYWYDKGVWYLDATKHFNDYTLAKLVAKGNNELAIWCWKTSTSINL